MKHMKYKVSLILGYISIYIDIGCFIFYYSHIDTDDIECKKYELLKH